MVPMNPGVRRDRDEATVRPRRSRRPTPWWPTRATSPPVRVIGIDVVGQHVEHGGHAGTEHGADVRRCDRGNVRLRDDLTVSWPVDTPPLASDTWYLIVATPVVVGAV